MFLMSNPIFKNESYSGCKEANAGLLDWLISTFNVGTHILTHTSNSRPEHHEWFFITASHETQKTNPTLASTHTRTQLRS